MIRRTLGMVPTGLDVQSGGGQTFSKFYLERAKKVSQTVLTCKPGFHAIVSNVTIISVTEFLVTQLGHRDRTRFYRDDRFAPDVRIV